MEKDKKRQYDSPEAGIFEVRTENVICDSDPKAEWFGDEEPMEG